MAPRPGLPSPLARNCQGAHVRYCDGERVGVLRDVRVTRVLRRMIIKPFAILALRTFWYRDKTGRGFGKDV